MKSLEEILKQPPVFLNNFSDKDAVARCFAGTRWGSDEKQEAESLKLISGKNILFASYGQDNYTGDAYVLFEEDGKLLEVYGGHCSCYGLEGQFDPSETTLEALKMALDGTFGTDDYSGNQFADELKTFLGIS
jgi:hypothetical protein